VHQGTEAGAKGRLKELLAEKGLRVEWSSAVDKTPSHRPLVNIYRKDGSEIGATLLREGFAREWSRRIGTGGAIDRDQVVDLIDRRVILHSARNL
jgi:endonuclease YncB( thermonuclease family)